MAGVLISSVYAVWKCFGLPFGDGFTTVSWSQLFDAQRREMTRRHVSEAEQSTVHLRDRSALREGSKLVDTMSWSSNASHAHASRAHTASDAHGRQTRALSAAHTAEWRLSNSIAMDGDEANHDTRTAGRPLRSLKGSLSAGLQPAVAPQWRTAGDGLVPAKQRAGMPVRSYEYEEDHAPGSTAPAATRVPAWQAAHAQRADLGVRTICRDRLLCSRIRQLLLSG